jgi:hypothetical protein
MSFRTPSRPGNAPPRSRVFDIACTLLAAPASFGSFSSPRRRIPRSPADPQPGHRGPDAAVPAQWPVRTELFQVALAISLYTVAVTTNRITTFVTLVVATLAPAAGQSGWLAAIYKVDRGSGSFCNVLPAIGVSFRRGRH